jgi:hypothetical protein
MSTLLQINFSTQFQTYSLLTINYNRLCLQRQKFENTGEDLEDLISIGTFGLIKAIESFHTGKGTKLATIAARCTENEILMHISSQLEEDAQGRILARSDRYGQKGEQDHVD